jgi:hypothetical protein
MCDFTHLLFLQFKAFVPGHFLKADSWTKMLILLNFFEKSGILPVFIQRKWGEWC